VSTTYTYPRPALTVDVVVFGADLKDEDLRVLLIRRRLEPYKGRWALPGGFVHVGEGLELAARRELQEETGLQGLFLEQLYTFGEPARDPREHTVSVAWFGLVKLSDHQVRAATDADDVGWFSVADPPELAFDHDNIVATAIERLRGKVRWQPLGFELLPPSFTLGQLQRLYEIVLQRTLDKRNFRKKMLAMGILQDTGEVQKGVAHRAARLYRFDAQRYEAKQQAGFNFEI